MQVLYLGRAPRTKETLPNFLKWRRVTRHPLVFRGLTGSQWTPGFGASQYLFYAAMQPTNHSNVRCNVPELSGNNYKTLKEQILLYLG